MYSMLVENGLDSPTPSHEVNRSIMSGRPNGELGAYGISFPIRDSATNLIVLGQHILTPKQGKSPLGRTKKEQNYSTSFLTCEIEHHNT